MSAIAVGCALGAALCYALSASLQHRAATDAGGTYGSIRLLWQLARDRRWALSLLPAAIGLILHSAAVRYGALAVVQPLLVIGLAFALPMRALLDRARPSAADVAAAIVLAIGVAAFLYAADPTSGQKSAASTPAGIVIAVGVLVVVVCWLAATRFQSGWVAGLALGVAAGTLYGLAGGALKAAVHALAAGPDAIVTTWPFWALLGLGGWAVLLHMRAYARAPLRVSLPALTVANPLVAFFFAQAAFAEKADTGLAELVTEIVAVAVITASVAVLARPRAAFVPELR